MVVRADADEAGIEGYSLPLPERKVLTRKAKRRIVREGPREQDLRDESGRIVKEVLPGAAAHFELLTCLLTGCAPGSSAPQPAVCTAAAWGDAMPPIYSVCDAPVAPVRNVGQAGDGNTQRLVGSLPACLLFIPESPVLSSQTTATAREPRACYLAAACPPDSSGSLFLPPDLRLRASSPSPLTPRVPLPARHPPSLCLPQTPKTSGRRPGAAPPESPSVTSSTPSATAPQRTYRRGGGPTQTQGSGGPPLAISAP